VIRAAVKAGDQARVSVIAFSGHPETHSPQAWQAQAFEANACCQR
jgi:hypothetical protein